MIMQTVAAALVVNCSGGCGGCKFDCKPTMPGMPNLPEYPPTPSVPVIPPDSTSQPIRLPTSTRPPGPRAPPNARSHNATLDPALLFKVVLEEGLSHPRMLVSLMYLEHFCCCSTYLFVQESKNSKRQ